MSIPQATATRWPLVLLLVGAAVVAAFQIGKAPAALPAIRDELGLGLVAASWVISIFNTLGLVLGMAVGGLAERLGHRRVVLAGLAMIAFASAAGAAAPGGTALLAARGIEGLGFLAIVIATPTLIVRAAAQADLKLAFGFWSSYMPVGTATMMLAAPLVLAPAGWRGLWLANTVLVGVFALMLARATAPLPTPPAAPQPLAAGIAETLRAPGPRLLALTFATYTFQYLAVFGLLPTVLIETDGVSPALAATLAALAIACNAPGNVIGGWLLQRGAPRWALVAGASAGMAALAVPLYALDLALPWRVVAAAALSLVAGGVPSSVLGGAPALAPSPRHVALTNGLIVQGGALGQTLGPPAVAALAQATGSWSWSPAALGASAALGILFALRLRMLEAVRR